MEKEKQSNQANDTRIHIFPIKPLHFLLKDISIFESITPATRHHDINILVPTLPQEINSHGENWAWISIVSVLTAPQPHLI